MDILKYVQEKVKDDLPNLVMFELNDEYTRETATTYLNGILEKILDTWIKEFYVVCDETNNDEIIIANNEFVVDIFYKCGDDKTFKNIQIKLTFRND